MTQLFKINLMNTCILFCLLTMISISFSCKKEIQEKENKIIDVETAVNTKDFSILNLSDYAESVQYIPLETSDSVLIQNINNIYYEEGHIIINDTDKRILVFDTSGKFQNYISKTGQGPGEFIKLEVINIFPDNNYCYILDRDSKILKYNLDGTFIKSIKIKTPENHLIYNLKSLTPSVFVCNFASGMQSYFRFAIYDDAMRLKKMETDYDPIIKDSRSFGSLDQGFLMYCNNEVLHYKSTTDTIWSIDKQLNTKPAFIFNYGKYKMPYETSKIFGRNIMANYIQVKRMLASSRYLFMMFDLGNQALEWHDEHITNIMGEKRYIKFTTASGIFDKKTGKLSLMKQPLPKRSGFRNERDEKFVFWPRYISSTGVMITNCSANDFLTLYEETENPSKELKTIAQKLKPDDNPVVIIARLKE